jgi:glycosyltransferase involved in cell wall biosynthesis
LQGRKGEQGLAGKIWVDVEDLFEYARFNPRPSGIQRVEYELCRALAENDPDGGSIGFLRHVPSKGTFRCVGWAEVSSLFAGLTDPGVRPAARRAAVQRGKVASQEGSRGPLKKLAYRLPPDFRFPLSQAVRHQMDALRAAAAAGRVALQGVRRRAAAARPDLAAGRDPGQGTPQAAERMDFESQVQPGDVLAVLGSPWFHPEYGRIISRLKRDKGVGFALLIYDIIPLRRPEWCDAGLVRIFSEWLGAVLPLADDVLTISHASAADVERFAAQRGQTLRRPPVVVPMGTGFSSEASAILDDAEASRLPPAGSYALIVSTIEARKNHLLLFRVWRRLLDEMPPEAVPTLVFAGRIGWLVDDLMQQLRNAGFLEGKIVVIENPSDGELGQLYRGCLFTVFPSFYEGWGLPVTESLSFGKPCIVSNSTSLPEAGGTLARYFDPENSTEAYQVIRDVIEHPAQLEAWEAQVVREFRRVEWTEAAQVVRQALLPPPGAPEAAADPEKPVRAPVHHHRLGSF